MTLYPAHNLPEVLRETLQRVAKDFDPNSPDPDLVELKRILQEKIAALEKEERPEGSGR